jgi:hypothetical protein
VVREVAKPLVRDGHAQLVDEGDRLRLLPSRPDAAAVEVQPTGPYVQLYFGPDHSINDELMDEEPVDLLRRILEATTARGLVYAVEPERDAYREVFTYGDGLERASINFAGGHDLTEREEHRFAPYA